MTWSCLQRLKDYRLAPRSSGLYVIGSQLVGAPPISQTNDSDPYLGQNFPHHFQRLYVGRSDKSIRTRLSAHWRGRGNKGVKKHKEIGTPLFFTYLEGKEFAHIEVFWLISFNPKFSCNVRAETQRSAKERAREIRSQMSRQESDFYDNLPPPEEQT